MKKIWEVSIDGVKHVIEYKAVYGIKIIVDGNVNKVKSSNWFINMIDYSISIGSTDCRLVAVGNKVDLAVNGTYLGSGKPYESLNSIPGWIYVLVGLSTVGGFFFCGVIGMAIGLLMSTLYIKMGLQKKTGAVIGMFIGCTVIQLLLMLLVSTALKI